MKVEKMNLMHLLLLSSPWSRFGSAFLVSTGR